MTRYEALNLAIAIVEKSDNTDRKQIVKCLKMYVRTLNDRKWSEEKIFAYCDKVVAEKGRLLMSDFGFKGAPGHGDIAQVFKMRGKEFRDKYYPVPSKLSPMSMYFRKSKEEWTALFVEDYIRIRPKTQTEYNKKRGEGLPRWNVIARWNNTSSWRELLAMLGLKRPTTKHITSVSGTVESIEKIKGLRKERESYRDFALAP